MIQARYQIPTTSPGAILRDERKMGTALGLEAEKSTSHGQLAPDEIVNEVVRCWLSRHDHSFTFDGYPRSLGQATALDEMLAERKTLLDIVILLDADLQTIQNRVERRLMCVGCGRIVSLDLHIAKADAPCPSCAGRLIKRRDDTPETLESRMREYSTKTEPLIGYYRGRGLLRLVAAARPPEFVFASIVSILEES